MRARATRGTARSPARGRGGASRRRRRMGGPRGGAVRARRGAPLDLPACCATSCSRRHGAAGRQPRRAALRHRPRRLPCGRPLPGAAEAGGAARAPRGPGDGGGDRDVNARILQAVTPEQREIFTSSRSTTTCSTPSATRAAGPRPIAGARGALARAVPAQAAATALVLSASDIDTYRTCPLKYKFARVFRIPQEPTIHQRFGILVHQVLERFHAGARRRRIRLAELLGLLEAGWRRGGFGDSEEERQLRGKATAALARYHERFRSEEAEPVWFERQFAFKVGPPPAPRPRRPRRPPARRRVRADRLQDRRPKSAGAARRRRAAVAVRGRRRARPGALEASTPAYYYVLDDEKVARPARRRRARRLDPRGRHRGRRGHPLAGLRADAVARGVLAVRLPARLPGG